MSTQRPVPSERSDTIRPEEVHRKNFEEMLHSAFNKDQIAVLNALMSGAGSVVDWNQKYDEGVNIADISIDGVTTPIYAPEGGGDQVQSDWNVSDSSSLAFIKNKPTIPAAQIQSDWNQTNASAKDFIKNKPTIPAASSSPRNLLFIGDIDYRAIMRATSRNDAEQLNKFLDLFTFNSSNYATKTPSTLYLLLPHYDTGSILKSVSRTYDSSEGEVRYVFNTAGGSSRACTVTIRTSDPIGNIYFASSFKDVYSLVAFSNYNSLTNLSREANKNLGQDCVVDQNDPTMLYALTMYGGSENYLQGVKNTIMLFYEM